MMLFFSLFVLALDAGMRSDRVIVDGHALGSTAQLTADLEGSGLLPGEAVDLVLQVRYGKNSSLSAPTTLPEGKGMMATAPPKRTLPAVDDLIIETLRYPLVILDVGEIEAPPFKCKSMKRYSMFPPCPFRSWMRAPLRRHLVGFRPMRVLRPGRPLRSIGSWRWSAAWHCCFFSFRWPRRTAEETTANVEVVDPYQQATEGLKALRVRLHEPAAQRQVWFELLAVLRRYLDARFGLHTAESTSEEILRASTETALPGVPRQGLKALLLRADQVRYAAAEADREAIADLIDLVEGWIREAERSQDSSRGESR